MRKLRWVSLAVLCLCCATVWAQGAPQVFVSTGTAGNIYTVDTVKNTVSLLVSTPGADYEGMVVAPDNTAQGANDTSTHYLVYVCDPTHNSIVRFNPSNPGTLDPVYSGGALQGPQCGRITSTGDLVVSSTTAGSGLWLFPGVTNVAIGSGLQTPTQVVGVSGSGEGLAQKNTGDILVVDNTNNQVRRAPLGSALNTTAFISSGLSQPFGIARRGDGFIYVSNQGGKPNVLQFNAQGSSPSTCQSFNGKDVPKFLQMSLDNTLYIAVSGGTSGSVRAVSAGNCSVRASYSIPFPAVGLALSPTMTATQNVAASNGTSLINFGFAAFEMNQIAGTCNGSISVGLYSPAAINMLIGLSASPATPAVNLGLDGFEAVFSTANVNGCLAKDNLTNNFQMSHFLSVNVTNPQIVVCDDANTSCAPGNVNLLQIGMFPIGGYLPQDLSSSGSKSLRCNIFMVNAQQQSGTPGQEPGTFCGFQSPVNDTFSPSLGTWNPALASSFSAGKSVPVKFKLGTGLGANACQNAPFITDAVALLSVAQVSDSKGNSTFVPIGLVSNGSSGLAQPLFKSDNNQQYLFNWDSSSCIMPSGVTQVCPKGTYSLTVVFLTNNTSLQTIYDVQTTLVVLK